MSAYLGRKEGRKGRLQSAEFELSALNTRRDDRRKVPPKNTQRKKKTHGQVASEHKQVTADRSEENEVQNNAFLSLTLGEGTLRRPGTLCVLPLFWLG